MTGTRIYKQGLPLIVGTAIYAFGIHYFVVPNQLMEGGLTGVSLLLNYTLHFRPSMTTLLLNIPLFYLGLRQFGKKAMLLTMIGTILLSFFLWLMEILIQRDWITPFISRQDYFLVVLYAGVTLGLGLGLVFRSGGTTGGTDIIAGILRKKRGASMGQMIFLIDVIVIGSSLLYISKEKVLYTLVVVFISSRVIDFVQEGAYAAKAFTIISEHSNEIARKIEEETERGMTFFDARGGYSRNVKQVIYCVVYRNEARRLRSMVRAIDPHAFMIIHDVHDVLGEGFKTE